MSDFFEDAKDSITIPELWIKLGLDGEPKSHGIVKSPFRGDRNPSFSIFDHGRKFRDHASGDSGDIFDFYMLARGCDKRTAVEGISAITGLRADQQESTLPMKKFHRPSVSSSSQSYCIEPAKIKLDGDWTLQFFELSKFLGEKRISHKVFQDLYNQGHLDLEGGVLNYHYSTGTKTRYDWASSRSTRWKVGGASDAVWLDHYITNPEIARIFVCEGESDAMRLMSLGLPDYTGVISIPSASWIPSPVLAGQIGNGRDVYLMFDNDDAGRKASSKVLAAIQDDSIQSNIIELDWKDRTEKDLCELDDETLKKLIRLSGMDIT